MTDHICRFGPWEQSRFAGTTHRKCVTPGCREITLDDYDDEPLAEEET